MLPDSRARLCACLPRSWKPLVLLILRTCPFFGVSLGSKDSTQSSASQRRKGFADTDCSGRNIGSRPIRSTARRASGPSASSSKLSPPFRSASNTSRMRSAGYCLPLKWIVTVLLNESTQLTNCVAGDACKPSELSRVSFRVTRSTSGRKLRNMIMACLSWKIRPPRVKASGTRWVQSR